MGLSRHVDRLNFELPIFNCKELQVNLLNYDAIVFIRFVIIFEKSTNPNKLQHNVSLHLIFDCLPKYLFALGGK